MLLLRIRPIKFSYSPDGVQVARGRAVPCKKKTSLRSSTTRPELGCEIALAGAQETKPATGNSSRWKSKKEIKIAYPSFRQKSSTATAWAAVLALLHAHWRV
jgi:hypothetical protein